MKLHEAIKQVVQCDGESAITDLKTINILSDFQAYTDCPSAKYVLRAMIADGYSKRLLDIGSWSLQAEQLMNKFVNDTGFQQQIANQVFQSVAYGLGWKNSVDVTDNGMSPQPSQNPSHPQPNSNGSQLNKTKSQIEKLGEASLEKYKYDAESYLESIVEFKSDFKKELGVDISLSIEFDDYADLSFRFERNAKIKYKYVYSIIFHVIIYGENNRILTKDFVYAGVGNLTYEVCEVKIYANSYKRISNIKRIVAYWSPK